MCYWGTTHPFLLYGGPIRGRSIVVVPCPLPRDIHHWGAPDPRTPTSQSPGESLNESQIAPPVWALWWSPPVQYWDRMAHTWTPDKYTHTHIHHTKTREAAKSELNFIPVFTSHFSMMLHSEKTHQKDLTHKIFNAPPADQQIYFIWKPADLCSLLIHTHWILLNIKCFGSHSSVICMAIIFYCTNTKTQVAPCAVSWRDKATNVLVWMQKPPLTSSKWIANESVPSEQLTLKRWSNFGPPFMSLCVLRGIVQINSN